MKKNEETKTVILTEEFKESLSRFFSVPTARQMESMFEFAIGSIAATGEREGWNEGVADGLCRQVTKLIEAEVIQNNWGRKVSSLASEIISSANKEWGIRESIKNIILSESIDFDLLFRAIVKYYSDLYKWTYDNYGKRLKENDIELPL